MRYREAKVLEEQIRKHAHESDVVSYLAYVIATAIN